MIIEILSTPGSGKSYYTEKIHKQLYELGYRASSLRDHQSLNDHVVMNKILRVYFLVRCMDAITLRLIIRIFRREKFKSAIHLSLYVLNTFRTYMIRQRFQSENQENIGVIDEGVIHMLHLAYDKKELEVIVSQILNHKRILKKYYGDEEMKFVFINSDIDSIVKRISNRSSGWPKTYKDLSFEQKVQKIKHIHRFYQELVTVLSTMVNVLNVDNSLGKMYDDKLFARDVSRFIEM